MVQSTLDAVNRTALAATKDTLPDASFSDPSIRISTLEGLRRAPPTLVALQPTIDINALEQIYRSSGGGSAPNPGAGGAGGFLRNAVIMVAPLLQSTFGQSRSTQIAESTLVGLGVDGRDIAKAWSQEQKNYYVNMIGLAAEETDRQMAGRGGRYQVVDQTTVREIFKRTVEMDTNPRASNVDEKIKIYTDLLNSTTDPTTRRYAQGWLDKLQAGGGSPPTPPPGARTAENECPANWNRDAYINDGRHRLQAIQNVMNKHGDFMVPITATVIDRDTGRRRDVPCEVPASELLKIRVNQGAEMRSGQGRNPWENMTPEQVQTQIRNNPDLRIKVNR